jgi:putative DNA primase/helicase
MCGGTDRFRFTDKEGFGMYICSVCGANDGFKLVQAVTGKSFRQVADRVSEILQTPTGWVKKEDDRGDDQKEAIKRIWSLSEPPSAGGPVSRYLKHRLGLQWASKSVREFVGKNTCLMVCKIVGPDDKAHNVHLTYINPDGTRAGVKPSKRVMAGRIPAGSAIRLAPAGSHMGVAEGIETAIAASVLHTIPVWSCINAGNLAKWEPPAIAKRITIFGDNDESFTGHAAAYTLARRLKLQFKLEVDVAIPETAGQDWADVLAQVSTGQVPR